MLYIVEGTDHRGRRFRGVYDKETTDYLLASDRLNTVVATINHRGKIDSLTNERTN